MVITEIQIAIWQRSSCGRLTRLKSSRSKMIKEAITAEQSLNIQKNLPIHPLVWNPVNWFRVNSSDFFKQKSRKGAASQRANVSWAISIGGIIVQLEAERERILCSFRAKLAPASLALLMIHTPHQPSTSPPAPAGDAVLFQLLLCVFGFGHFSFGCFYLGTKSQKIWTLFMEKK